MASRTCTSSMPTRDDLPMTELYRARATRWLEDWGHLVPVIVGGAVFVSMFVSSLFLAR